LNQKGIMAENARQDPLYKKLVIELMQTMFHEAGVQKKFHERVARYQLSGCPSSQRKRPLPLCNVFERVPPDLRFEKAIGFTGMAAEGHLSNGPI
jgi:hypothetical protein